MHTHTHTHARTHARTQGYTNVTTSVSCNIAQNSSDPLSTVQYSTIQYSASHTTSYGAAVYHTYTNTHSHTHTFTHSHTHTLTLDIHKVHIHRGNVSHGPERCLGTQILNVRPRVPFRPHYHTRLLTLCHVMCYRTE